MARKYGIINQMSTKFEDYSYIINGVGGIGKTTMAYEIGLKITGSNEGTFIITCGEEPDPSHIHGALYDVAPSFKEFQKIVKELCENKAEYPDTVFVAIDSVDEFCRIVDAYVVEEYNNTCTGPDVSKRTKTIKGAYGGFQGGENRAVDIMATELGKLKKAGYRLLEIGHTKVKTKTDVITGVGYEQLTCNLDNKYYNALKDKVNLVAMCYIERTIDDIKDVKDPFSKTTKKKGNLKDEQRVIVFRDDDMAIDTKSHFKHIVNKVEFSTDNFINAVQDAIKADLEEISATGKSNPIRKPNQKTDRPAKETTSKDVQITSGTEDEKMSEDCKADLINTIREKFGAADKELKIAVKEILKEKGQGKLDDSLSMDVLAEINEMF